MTFRQVRSTGILNSIFFSKGFCVLMGLCKCIQITKINDHAQKVKCKLFCLVLNIERLMGTFRSSTQSHFTQNECECRCGCLCMSV